MSQKHGRDVQNDETDEFGVNGILGMGSCSRSRSTYFRRLALVHKPVGYLAYVLSKLWITSKASLDLIYGDS